MPGGWSDPKKTFLVKAETERKVYVRAYTKVEAMSIIRREGVYEELSTEDAMKKPDEVMEEVWGKDVPVISDDIFAKDPKKSFLVRVKPEDIKQIEQREVYVRTSTEKDATQELLSGLSGGIERLLIVPDLIAEEVQERDVPLILDDPCSVIAPTKREKEE